VIEGSNEFYEIIGKSKKMTMITTPERVILNYDRPGEIATVKLVQPSNHRTIDSMLLRKEKKSLIRLDGGSTSVETGTTNVVEEMKVAPVVVPVAAAVPVVHNVLCLWTCLICTFEHHEEEQQHFLACSVCGAERRATQVST